MKNTANLLIVLSGLIFSVICGDAQASAPKQRPRRAHTVIYALKETASAEQKAAATHVLNKYRLQTERRLVKNRLCRAAAQASIQTSEEDLCAELQATGAFAFAEPDYLIVPDEMPNDPGYPSQWFHAKISSPAAWDITIGQASVIVAVCDTGVESSHPDLAGNILLPGFNAVDNSSNAEPVHYHGTRVAGCIGALGNNGIGVAGVCWRVKILPVRISNNTDGSAYLSDMAEGIRWAADRGAKVVNLSYTGAGSYTIDSAAQYLRSKGGLLFMAAGNSGLDQSGAYPDFTSFVAVGATTSSDTRASWSNYGTFIDIVAPGEGIYTTSVNGSYAGTSGTSFSSPISAGLAALLYSINPDFTPAQIENAIFSTCVDLGATGDDNIYGHGRINAAAAVAYANISVGNTPPVAIPSASPESGEAPLEVTFDGSESYDTDGSIISYAWDFGDGTEAEGVRTTHTYLAAGTYSVILTVTDDAGATSSATFVITVTPAPVHDIAVAAIQAPGTAQADEIVALSVIVQNRGNYAESFDVTVTESPDGVSIGQQLVTGLSTSATKTLLFSWPTGNASIGSHTITAYTTPVKGEGDIENNRAEASIVIAGPLIPICVRDISLRTRRTAKTVRAYATVSIVDVKGSTVGEALVYGTWSGVIRANQTKNTGANGTALFSSETVKGGGTFVFAVTNVVKEGCIYLPGASAETTDSVTEYSGKQSGH